MRDRIVCIFKLISQHLKLSVDRSVRKHKVNRRTSLKLHDQGARPDRNKDQKKGKINLRSNMYKTVIAFMCTVQTSN